MRLIDTHTHLYLKDFKDDIDSVINKARSIGVEKFYLPAIDSSELSNLISLEKKYPGVCIAMMGLHPCSVKENYEEEMRSIENLLEEREFAAIGEIGLDFYWDKTFTEQQFECFHRQIKLALKYKIPINIHSRNALDEAIDVVKQYFSEGVRGIFHCFGGTIEQANKIVSLGFYLGIGGVVTYKKSGLAEVLSQVDLKHIVLETDSPYLTPVPYRGKRNESSYLLPIVTRIAEIKCITVAEAAGITTQNAEALFSKA